MLLSQFYFKLSGHRLADAQQYDGMCLSRRQRNQNQVDVTMGHGVSIHVFSMLIERGKVVRESKGIDSTAHLS